MGRIQKNLSLEDERKRFVVKYLRRASMFWPKRNEALRRAKVGSSYLCNYCKKLHPRWIMRVDHIDPVSTKEGIDLSTILERMFCSSENFQVLCKPCHDIKTAQESSQRAQERKNRKSSSRNSSVKP